MRRRYSKTSAAPPQVEGGAAELELELEPLFSEAGAGLGATPFGRRNSRAAAAEAAQPQGGAEAEAAQPQGGAEVPPRKILGLKPLRHKK